MTLEKAIEIMELNLKEAGTKMPVDCKFALQIHIEAAKREQQWRKDNGFQESDLLPGETTE